MTLTPTLYRFGVELSQVDRGRYEALDLRLAKHPSETERALCARLLAYCIFYEPELAFSKEGLSSRDEPPISVRRPEGTYALWIELGTPTGERIHKASKAADTLVVLTHNDPRLLRAAAKGVRIHKVEEVQAYALAPAFLDAIAKHFGARGTKLGLTVTDGDIYVDIGGETLTGRLEAVSLLEAT